MAGVLDILLRVKGDSSDAVKAMDDTTAAARRTENAAEKTQRQLRNLLTVATVSSVVSAIGDIRAAVETLFSGLNAITGTDARHRRAEEVTAQAVDAPGLAAAIQAQAIDAATGPRFLGMNLIPGYDPSVKRVHRALRKQLLAADPAIVRAVAPFLEDQDLANEVLATLTARQAGSSFQSSLTTQPPNVHNITVNTGVGDPNRIGREIKAATDARDRNNGRYTSTSTRRR